MDCGNVLVKARHCPVSNLLADLLDKRFHRPHGRFQFRNRRFVCGAAFAATGRKSRFKHGNRPGNKLRCPHCTDGVDALRTLLVDQAAVLVHQQGHATAGHRQPRNLIHRMRPGIFNAELARYDIAACGFQGDGTRISYDTRYIGKPPGQRANRRL